MSKQIVLQELQILEHSVVAIELNYIKYTN